MPCRESGRYNTTRAHASASSITRARTIGTTGRKPAVPNGNAADSMCASARGPMTARTSGCTSAHSSSARPQRAHRRERTSQAQPRARLATTACRPARDGAARGHPRRLRWDRRDRTVVVDRDVARVHDRRGPRCPRPRGRATADARLQSHARAARPRSLPRVAAAGGPPRATRAAVRRPTASRTPTSRRAPPMLRTRAAWTVRRRERREPDRSRPGARGAARRTRRDAS